MELASSRGLTLSETASNPPPEPGFARREAHYAQWNHLSGDRPTAQLELHPRRQGGGTRGNQGFPRDSEGPRSGPRRAKGQLLPAFCSLMRLGGEPDPHEEGGGG